MTQEERNARNMEVFAARGTDDEDERRHVCVLCGRAVSISESQSHLGRNLICYPCYYRQFPSATAALKWIHGKAWE